MLGKARTYSACLLTAGLLLFLIGGAMLSAFPAGVPITDEKFADPGFLVDGRTLHLGASNRGSDLLSDLVSATWFNTWTGFVATIASLPVAYLVWRLAGSKKTFVRLAGFVIVRISCAFTLLPPFMLLVMTQIYYPAAPLSLIALLAFYAFPFGVHLLSVVTNSNQGSDLKIRSIVVYALRRWAALHMLVGALGWIVWLRSAWPGDIIDIFKGQAALMFFGFGAWQDFLSIAIYIAIALCLRLWASMLEERWSIAPLPIADSWVYLPTMLEDEALQKRQTANPTETVRAAIP